MSAKKYVYLFGQGMSDGDASMNELLGGKGANLAEMAKLGLPVPAGFTITTECCVDYFANGQKNPAGLDAQITGSSSFALRSGSCAIASASRSFAIEIISLSISTSGLSSSAVCTSEPM